jgi:hypothetical protein
MPYVFLAIAVVSVLASLLMWKHQRDHKSTPGTPVITATHPTPAPGGGALAIQVVRAPDIWHCAPGADNVVALSWETTGATSVTVAVDKPSDTKFSDQPPTGQALVPGPCSPHSHVYYVIAKAADGKQVIKSATTKGV